MSPSPELPLLDACAVAALISRQRPDWASLPLTGLTTCGTEHDAWRLGDDLLLRLPRDAEAADGLTKETRWLPRLTGRLPLSVPPVQHVGHADDGFPYGWVVTDWVPGEDAAARVLADGVGPSWADVLADLVVALRAIDLASFPRGGWPVGGRGGALEPRVAQVRDNPSVLGSIRSEERPWVDLVLTRALRSEPAAGPPVLLHADLIPGNLVHRDGSLVALLDLATLTTGTPAWDLTPAWWVLDPAGRAAFRERLEVDDATWARGRALALTQGLLARWYYEPRGHPLAPLGARAVAQALMDH